MFSRKLAPFNLSAVIVFYANPKSEQSPTDSSIPQDVKFVPSLCSNPSPTLDAKRAKQREGPWVPSLQPIGPDTLEIGEEM